MSEVKDNSPDKIKNKIKEKAEGIALIENRNEQMPV